MPYIPAARRAQGGYKPQQDEPDDINMDAVDWSVPQPAHILRRRVLPVPDQSRYGTATTDPPKYRTDGIPA